MHQNVTAAHTTSIFATLEELVAHFEDLVTAGSYVAARELFSTETLGIWFGMPSARLAHIVNMLVEADPERIDLVTAIHVFIRSASEGRFFEPKVLQALEGQSPSYGTVMQVLYMYSQRMLGRPVEALELGTKQTKLVAVIQPYFDARNSWPLFESLQRGFTAMLAGDYQHALTALAEARMRPTAIGMQFLSRDAWAKTALLHAALGDPVEARSSIEQAAKFDTSGSWAESAIDVHIDLAEVLLENDPEAAFLKLKAIDMQNIGEVWSFYIFTVFRTYTLVGAGSEVEHQLAQLQSLPFPLVTGQGFTGSVFPVTLALHELFSGRGHAAKLRLRDADPSVPLSQFAEALIEIYTGNPKRALQLATAMRSSTYGLRQLELMRLSVEASAHLTLGDERALLITLKQALQLPRGLTTNETRYFLPDARAFAIQALTEWPVLDGEGVFDTIPQAAMHLTDRELDVLGMLAQDLTRTEIAEQLYLSVNTVKTQISSLYRKLRASSREEALLEASRLGIL